MAKLRCVTLGRGRMGEAVVNCLESMDDLQLAGVWSRTSASADLMTILTAADVAIDFTLADATGHIVRACVQTGVPLVSGVSGMSDATRAQLQEAAGKIAILHDRNMSLGIAVMQQLVQMAGRALGDQFETEIHETHHIHKIDAPSGTALQLGEALAASKGQDFKDACHYDPDGDSQPASGQIAFSVARQGEVRGEHSVKFSNLSERLVLQHEVTSRRVFAEGAIKAARWLVNQKPGLYSMQDVIR